MCASTVAPVIRSSRAVALFDTPTSQPSPLLFRQARHGFNNITAVYEFRSMLHRPSADSAHNDQYAALTGGYLGRHRVQPGITGWAQVNGSALRRHPCCHGIAHGP